MAVRRFLVAGRYRLHEPVGSGGMGRVWMARDEMLDRDVAVKEFVPPDWMTDAEKSRLRDRTLREARSAARLNHPHVVQIYDVVHAEDLPWIVMEYVPSRSLFQVINEDGPFTPAAAAKIGLAVLDALTAAHAAGVLHRDIKPHNVLIGNDGRVVLTDFGLATFVDDGTVTGPGLVVGSPQYVSPERARDGASTVESDLWSFGATLYAAVEGRSPYARESAMATLMALATEEPDPPVIAGPLTEVLMGLLRREPSERMSATEVENRLRAIVGTGKGPVLAESTVGRKISAGRAAVVPAPRRPAEDERAPEPDALAPNGKGAAVATAPPPTTTNGVRAGSGGTPPIQLTPPQRRPPIEEAEHDGHSSARMSPIRSRTGAVLAGILVVVLLAGVGLAVTWIVRQRADDRQSAQSDGGRPGLTAPSAAPSVNAVGTVTSFSAASCMSPPSPDAPKTPQKGAKNFTGPFALFESWHLYVDPTGYRVAVPDGWTYQKVGTTMCFRDPYGGRFLSVDPNRNPAGDPVVACRTEATRMVKAGDLPSYKQVSLTRLPPVIKGADWEYTYQAPANTRMHAVTRWFKSGPRGYALTWAVRDFDWPAQQSVRTMIISSFKASGS
jgi:eukaryotic-like serine/threonine-protein kinase